MHLWLLIVACAPTEGDPSPSIDAPVVETEPVPPPAPTMDEEGPHLLDDGEATLGSHHTRHETLFGRQVEGLNRWVLRAVDEVQSNAMDGGGYFIGLRADPPESPVGFPLILADIPLLEPPRASSYCTGATYAALVHTLDRLWTREGVLPDDVRLEALRMQEHDGSRREDGVKVWGHWNDDGFGNHHALVQYVGAGEERPPERARPGDFVNVSWTSGRGHSVVFLGWHVDDTGHAWLRYWSSQPGTDGFGDQMSPVEDIASMKVVRLTDPDAFFLFDPDTDVEPVPGDPVPALETL